MSMIIMLMTTMSMMICQVSSQSQSREMSQSLVVTSQSGLPLHRSSSFHQVSMVIMMVVVVMMLVMVMMVMMLTSQGGLPLHMFTSFHKVMMKH